MPKRDKNRFARDPQRGASWGDIKKAGKDRTMPLTEFRRMTGWDAPPPTLAPAPPMRQKEFYFPALDKKVVVDIPRRKKLNEAFNETAALIDTLLARRQLQDPEAGLKPRHPTHAIEQGPDNRYYLKALRLG